MTGEDMPRLLDSVPPDVLVFFDEAYFEYASASRTYPDFRKMLEACRAPWLLLRTFSKAYGLAGVRVGYGLASDTSLPDLMNRVQSPFNVNRLTPAAAIAALENRDYMLACVARTVAERERVRTQLERLGYWAAPSLANFLFFDAREGASELATRLLTHGVIVKPWREPGFTNHIRVSIGTRAENDQFLNALALTACTAAAGA